MQMSKEVLAGLKQNAYVLDIAPGQIRLLHHGQLPLAHQPEFVLIVRCLGRLTTILPFGQLDHPILASEFKTELAAPELRLLEIWEAMAVGPAQLDASRVVGYAPLSLRTVAYAMLRHQGTDWETPLPNEVINGLGAPTVGEYEVAYGYQESRRVIWQSWRTKSRQLSARAMA